MTYTPKSGVAFEVESACIVAAFDIARTVNASIVDTANLTDEQKLAVGFGMLADRYAYTQQKPAEYRCGWCVEAAGGDHAAWQAAPTYDAAAIRAHTKACRLNPLVVELERLRAPVPMRLACPECGELHIDEDEFAAKAHHTHACQHCGNVWRPAIVATVGVRFLPGFQNEPTWEPPAPEPTWAYCEEPPDREFGQCSWNGGIESLVDGRCPNCGSSAILEGQP